MYDLASRPRGWRLEVGQECTTDSLDSTEQAAIKQYADLGYQLRNETTGSQGEGKKSLSDYGRGGYLKDKHEGVQKAVKEIGTAIEKYTTGLTSKGGKTADRKTQELISKLKGESI